MKSLEEKQSFWEDDFDGSPSTTVSLGAIKKIITYYLSIFSLVIILLSFLILYSIKPILSWVFLFYIGASIGFSLFRRKRIKTLRQQTISIQEIAKQRSGAVEIGSAIHVAGNPFLDREQPVVLALIEGKGLCFYKYDNDQPIDILPIDDIISIYTVVYDDERTPHIEAVDSAAQALQLVFKREGIEFTMLLRAIKKLRPIDWYQILQKSRTSQYPPTYK